MIEADVKLWKKYKRTKHKALREEIVRKYLYLVKYVAGRVAIGLPPNVEFNDLVSYGILGLFDAIEKYDVTQGNKFETYGVSRIRGAIMDELRKLDWAPRLLRKRAREIERKMRELEDRLGRTATEEELAKSMKMSVEDLNGIYSELNSTTFLSLDEVWQNDDGNKPISRLQTVEDSLITDQFSYVHQGEVKELLAQSIDQLPEKEKLVIVLYYYENLTLREIGEVLNVSESRVCQIHTKVVMRLRSYLMKKTGEITLEA
ncbi:MAG: FliA/WhiG family RNA polymerase sigma factor [Candidatus Omnitrophica bacterium]|nr:FliA/WhiG family RNA polymerase sigma factor [Candidatus Omnitrophota bacterium]